MPISIPGEDLFYEHVHLTFAGNYLLARTMFASRAKCSPNRYDPAARVTSPPGSNALNGWPSLCGMNSTWLR